MCGNGIRCVGKYVYDKGYTDKKFLSIETLSGVKYLTLQIVGGKVKTITVDMGQAEAEKAMNLTVDGETVSLFPVSVGNPHAVIFVDDIEKAPLSKLGPIIEHHEAFPDGVNVEFVEVLGADKLRMRVWERGSGVTMACGTGACASVIAKANLTIDAGKDAIHAENTDDASLGFIYIASGTIKAEAEGDGIAAGAYMQIVDGTIDLLVGGGAENGTKASSGNYGGFMGGGHGGMRPGGNQSSITTEDTVSMKGLKATNSLLISGGHITINSADDSVHSDVSVIINGGTFTIASGDDAIHAEDTLTITAGKMDISESYEGLEALHIDVQGGDIKLKASDDGLNAAGGTDQSGTEGGRDGMFGGGMGGGKPGGMGGHGGMSSNSNGSIKVSGGNLYINSSGDGLDANGTLEISGGHTTVVGPTQGDTATLDYDKSATITGGTFIGTGAQGMAQTFSDSEQGVIAISVGNQSAGTKIVLKDKNGKTIIEYSPELNFAVVILSSSEIKKGETYSVTVGSESGEFEAS